MKSLIILLLIPIFSFSQQPHKHIPAGDGIVYPFKETKLIDNGSKRVSWTKIKYVCGICLKQYDENVWFDTIPIVKQVHAQEPKTISIAQLKAQKTTHKHKPVIDRIADIDPFLYKDTSSIKYNVVTYVMRNYQCKICGLYYKERVNIDTFSTRRKAKYSNLKYPKPKPKKITITIIDSMVYDFSGMNRIKQH